MIRRATPEDLDLLMEIEEACFKEGKYSKGQIEWMLSGEDEATFICLEGSHPIGSVMLCAENGLGRIVSIGVHPEWRERGVAKELMDIAERWFSESGAREIYLEVSVENQEALSLYHSMGYEAVRVLKGYYFGKVDAFQMKKEVQV